MSFYELQAPTAWADPPSTWSSTSLDDVEACPRRWQLLRSRWGDFERFPVRPHPAAIEGQIVHEALDRLTRACGQRGNPAFGSAEFSAAMTDADFFPGFARAVAEWHQRLTKHPRPGPAFQLRASAEDLANRAVRMFREQYKPMKRLATPTAELATGTPADLAAFLQRKLVLSEVKLKHPKLPFAGVIDRVQLTGGGVEVVDFKTGKPSDKHRKQLLRYALLWWRKTGDMPARIVAQYLDGIGSWPVSLGALQKVESDLENKLFMLSDALAGRPAVVKTSADCALCPVRARCDPGWAVAENTVPLDGRGDVELTVEGTVQKHGFNARRSTGAEISIVYEESVGRSLPMCLPGQRFRVIDGSWRIVSTQLELRLWSEIYSMSTI